MTGYHVTEQRLLKISLKWGG